MRQKITNINLINGVKHTQYQSAGFGANIIYIEYLGGGSHITRGVISVDGYVARIERDAIKHVGTPRQPIAVYLLREEDVHLDVVNTDGLIKQIPTTPVTLTTATHMWGLKRI